MTNRTQRAEELAMVEEKDDFPVSIDPVQSVWALEQRTSGTRFMRFGPEFVLFRKGYEICLELLHHLGDVKPRDDYDRTQRDLVCDTLDSLRAAEVALLYGYDNQSLLLIRRSYETIALIAYFVSFPAKVIGL